MGVGPLDFPECYDQDTIQHLQATAEQIRVPTSLVENGDYIWPYADAYADLTTGNLLDGYAWFFARGYDLAIFPVSRLHVNRPAFFPGAVAFYPPGVASLTDLSVVPNRENAEAVAERCSFSSGVTVDLLGMQSLVVVPCRVDWRVLDDSSHEMQMEMIREFSEKIDLTCMNFLRYRLCHIEPIEGLPGHAGQIDDNPMIAGAVIYNHGQGQARAFGGAAFSHVLTRGLGLTLRQLEWNEFPASGEVGNIAQHALSLHTALLESSNPTSRFIQALSLLEFLASPDEYQKFKDVKKVIARYVARDRTQYHRILDRFPELTSKSDTSTGRNIGYRTRVVHMGERIEQVVPASESRKELFLELDGYIRPVMDHMIEHSEMDWQDYLRIRETLRPFAN
jgi:hypothetical protein